MRLGLWNRLAIVLIGAALLIKPAWDWGARQARFHKELEAMKDLCLAGTQSRYDRGGSMDEYLASRARCHEAFYSDGGPGWAEYGIDFAETAVACAVIYLLILGAVAIGKWVWRGRRIGAPIN